MDDRHGLRVFVQLAQSRRLTAAATRRGLSASDASKAMARLAQECGWRWLQRTARRSGLSSDGQLFFQRCRQI